MRAPLEVGYSARKQRGPLLLLGVIFLGVLLAWVFDVVPGWLGVVDTVLFGGVVVYGLVSLRRLRPDVTVVRLDAEGLTVVGARTVPWSDLSGVVVGPMRPVWLVASRLTQVVAFLPRDGVDLPGPPRPGRRPQAWGRAFRERLYGTNLLLVSSATTVRGREIADAAHELGGLPVDHVPHRGVRRWIAVLVAGLLLGLVIGLVRRLVG